MGLVRCLPVGKRPTDTGAQWGDMLTFMNGWVVLATALISAAVSLAVALLFRWWERRTIEWVVSGESHREYVGGKETGRIRATIQVHNAGDGDAYRVRLIRCNGGEYKPLETFVAGRVPAGGSIPVEMSVEPENWRTCWLEVIAVPTPVHLNRTNRSGRLLVQPALAKGHTTVPLK